MIRLLPRIGMLGLLTVPVSLSAQQTAAERSAYQATASYTEVVEFLRELQRQTPDIRVARLARSTEGKDIPWVLVASPMVDGPLSARASGKPVVYIQGNIHGGEVEGKEASQQLLRDLTLGPLRPVLDSVILLVVPIYNIDGNESVGPGEQHRPGQNGPPVVGLRPNGQGLDLNRDYVKMEAPETRGAVRLINQWDPDVFIDLHTTNGSYHGYALTYSPGLNPNDNPANAFVRDELLPAIRQRVRERHTEEMFWYGNFRNQHPDSLALGWYTYDARPRFGTNWFGMRGRIAILSEGYSNAPFEARVASTYNFVLEILMLVAEQRERIIQIRSEADLWRPEFVAVRSQPAPPDTMQVIAELTLADDDGAGPFARRIRTGEYRTITMPVYHRFDPALVTALPGAYLIPPGLESVAELLVEQGVQVQLVEESWEGPVEAFLIDSIEAAARAFQGHRLVSLSGQWSAATGSAAAGWFLVDTDQRLGLLAAFLLEPQSEDGLVAWNFLDRYLQRGRDYPVLRASVPPGVAATVLPLPR